MCNGLAIVWGVAAVKSPCRLPCKRSGISSGLSSLRVSCGRALILCNILHFFINRSVTIVCRYRPFALVLKQLTEVFL